jgi:hypothetical protein
MNAVVKSLALLSLAFGYGCGRDCGAYGSPSGWTWSNRYDVVRVPDDVEPGTESGAQRLVEWAEGYLERPLQPFGPRDLDCWFSHGRATVEFPCPDGALRELSVGISRCPRKQILRLEMGCAAPGLLTSPWAKKFLRAAKAAGFQLNPI